MADIVGIPDPWRVGSAWGSGARFAQIRDSGANGDAVLKRALSKVKPDEGGDAHTRFGKASRFTLTTPEQRTNPGATVTWPPDDPDEDPQDGVVIHDYDYVDRSVEVIRVEQEGEPENWVEVERIVKLMFVNRETGEYVRFNFDWSKKPSSSTHA